MGYFQSLLVFRRLGFGIKHSDIASKLSLTPSELIDELIDNAKKFTSNTDPGWAHWTNTDFRNAGGNEILQKPSKNCI